jgi:hypothetical protein
MSPDETHFAEDVHVIVNASGIRMVCDRCECVEIVLLDEMYFDSCVDRFTSYHPRACTAVVPPRTN